MPLFTNFKVLSPLTGYPSLLPTCRLTSGTNLLAYYHSIRGERLAWFPRLLLSGSLLGQDPSLPPPDCSSSCPFMDLDWGKLAAILSPFNWISSLASPFSGSANCPKCQESPAAVHAASSWTTAKASEVAQRTTGSVKEWLPRGSWTGRCGSDCGDCSGGGNCTVVNYVRVIQVLFSMLGIGLSLGLMYYLIEQLNPTAKEKRLARKRVKQIFSQMGIRRMPQLTDYEVCIGVNLVDTRFLGTQWASIGGLGAQVADLKESVIEPFRGLHLYPHASRLLCPPKGVLLYGPPGCGKTMIARAMAREAEASFINLQISTLVNMWYGETQKYVEATFTLAHKLQPAILFIDELDSFLTTRSCTDNESTRMIKTQFMALWDGLLTEDNSRILVVGATNRPGDLDQAILRRLPYKVHVPLPDAGQRREILNIYLHGEQLASDLTADEIGQIAQATDGLSGSDLHELCREAAFCCYTAGKESEQLENIRLQPRHFNIALKKYLSNRVTGL